MKKRVLALLITFLFIIPNIPAMKSVHAEGEKKGTPEHGIPVVNINIDESQGTIAAMNSSPDHSVKCYGTIDIDVPDGYVSDYSGTACEDIEGLEMEYIKGRGNSTWTQSEKKPYKIKLKKGKSIFGMGKSKHWALIANALENSHVRNRMTYWLGNEMGVEFTPKLVPVEVYMNGDYRGLYYLSETIRVEQSRVDIDELEEGDNDPDTITGGYLISTLDPEDAVTRDGFVTEKGMGFVFENPDFVEYKNDNQRKYIENYLTKTEEAIFGEGFKDKDGVSYKEYMDITAAADYWWFQTVSMNMDGFKTDSTYLTKKRNDKLYWGPLWDFDSPCWGNLSVVFGGDDYKGIMSDCTWLNQLRNDDEFVGVLKERWKLMDAKLIELTKKGGQLDKYYKELKPAADANAAKWGYYFDEVKSYEEAIEGLRKWIDKRREWINNNLDQLKLTDEPGDDEEDGDDDSGIDPEQKEELDPKEHEGTWRKNEKGWWYGDDKGWYAKDCWMIINSDIYYFDQDGYMASNEWRDGYWLDADGKLGYKYKGSWKENSKGWWFEDESGWFAKNQWQKIDGKWYFFCDDGYMDYSEYRDGCWLGADGAWDEAYGAGHWSKNSRGWWYSDGDWYPVNQYLWIDGVQYWFDASGYMK